MKKIIELTLFTNNIYLAFLLGFLTHFILDAIPHVDPGTFHNIKKRVIYEKEYVITPWEVKGEIDYDKLVTELIPEPNKYQ